MDRNEKNDDHEIVLAVGRMKDHKMWIDKK